MLQQVEDRRRTGMLGDREFAGLDRVALAEQPREIIEFVARPVDRSGII